MYSVINNETNTILENISSNILIYHICLNVNSFNRTIFKHGLKYINIIDVKETESTFIISLQYYRTNTRSKMIINKPRI